eukprot:TRINITY_DN28991_c0_g1_i3.p1 TRINITY_DN28991_c0_g1~~TRINITY_DN28991_c0_g1_i3.p1  ORF type:complete len:250 (+),score=51.30 TRINITY_DN28991_c0_g1_i3:191-940(+)
MAAAEPVQKPVSKPGLWGRRFRTALQQQPSQVDLDSSPLQTIDLDSAEQAASCGRQRDVPPRVIASSKSAEAAKHIQAQQQPTARAVDVTTQTASSTSTSAASSNKKRPPEESGSEAPRHLPQQRARVQGAASAADEAHFAEAADIVFSTLVQGPRSVSDSANLSGQLITANVLAAALQKYRIPIDMCRPEEADEMLAFALQRSKGLPVEAALSEAVVAPGERASLSRQDFHALFSQLGLQVTRTGRIW